MENRYWFPVACTLLIAGWGSNQFASMMSFYRDTYEFSQLSVTSMLGIYVLGLVPALLYGGSVSDRVGRKRTTQIAVILTLFSSLALIGGAISSSMLYIGRLISGVATGIIMATATSWVKELSQAPFDNIAKPGAGAKRATLAISGGFFLGPLASGFVARFLPLPEILPYILHLLLTAPVLLMLTKVPDTGGLQQQGREGPKEPKSNRSKRWSYLGARARFWRIVGFGAPWAFISGTVSWAVIPQTLHSLEGQLLLYSTISIALSAGFGVLSQPLAATLDRPGTARASWVGMLLVVVGMSFGILTGILQLPWLGLVSSSILGSGYGIMMSAGLLEAQRLSAASHVGAATGIFYTLAYAGFLAPTIIAFLELVFPERAILWGILVMSFVSFTVVLVNSRKYVPPQKKSPAFQESVSGRGSR